jgi:cytochrome c oxidase cbb3-type subunit 3
MTSARRIIRPSVLPAIVLLAVLGTAGALRAEGAKPLALPPEGQLSGVPVGELAGGGESNLASIIHNPAGASDVVAGRELYVHLNCADCHGFDGKGGMGPDLTDKSWIFGGTPAEIYKSIYEGRPEGMPAWGKALPPKDIWQLVAYIESLGGGYTPSQYQAERQGDVPGELVAPEINFEQTLDGSPPFKPPPGPPQKGASPAAAAGPSAPEGRR